MLSLLVALLLPLAPPAQAAPLPLPDAYALARYAGIRAEVAAKIALSAAGAGNRASAAFLQEGLLEGNLMKAAAGLPAAPSEALRALVEIRAKLPLEALDCETVTAGDELNCQANAATLAAHFPGASNPVYPAPLSEREQAALEHSLVEGPQGERAPKFLSERDVWTASELLGEADDAGARSFFDTMVSVKP